MFERSSLIGVAAGLLLLATTLPRTPGKRVPAGVTVQGVALGGMDETRARRALTASEGQERKPIILTGAGSWAIPRRALGVELDAQGSARLAVMVGARGTLMKRWWDLFLACRLPHSLPARYQVDAGQARVALRRLAARIDKEPRPARWQHRNGEARLNTHCLGRALDIEATLVRLKREAARGLRRPVPMALVWTEPALTAQALQEASEELGQARVPLGSGARWANARAGLRALDGWVIRAGSDGSACEAMLPFSPHRGYAFATDERGCAALGGGVEVAIKLLATAAGHAGLVTTWRQLEPQLAAPLPLRTDLLLGNSMTKDVVISAGVERGYGWVRIFGRRAPGPAPQPGAGRQLHPAGITLAFAGDLLPTSVTTGASSLAALVRKADVAFANLECPISTRGAPLSAKQAPGEFAFRAPPKVARQHLQAWGLDVVSVANNHALDYGPDALEDTLATLKQSGVRSTGAGMDATSAWRSAILDRGGLRIGFLCCVGSETLPVAEQFEAHPDRPGMAVLHTSGVRLAEACQELASRTRQLRWQVDLLIVSVHWGKEATGTPTAVQRELARAAASSGADIVLGHHPHRLQPFEAHSSDSCLIAYSLGNFIFPARRPRQRHSGVLLVQWGAKGLIAARFVPALIQGAQPRPVSDSDQKRQIAEEVLGRRETIAEATQRS